MSAHISTWTELITQCHCECNEVECTLRGSCYAERLQELQFACGWDCFAPLAMTVNIFVQLLISEMPKTLEEQAHSAVFRTSGKGCSRLRLPLGEG